MSFIDQIDTYRQNRAGQPGSSSRAFVTGPAVVNQFEAGYGVDPAQFSPDIYGNYLATSNSIYSVNVRRGDMLSALPLKLYRFDKSIRRRNLSYLSTLRQRVLPKLRMIQHQPNYFKRALAQEGLEEVTDGNLYELLSKVNPRWTLQRLINMTVMSNGIWGRSFWFLERGRSGKGAPKEIWWAKPSWVRPLPDEKNYISGFIFEPTGAGGTLQEIPFSPQETIWFNKPNPIDEFNGLSPLAASRIYADHENASMQSNINLHRQGLQIGGLIWPKETGQRWSKEIAQEIEEDLNRRFRGVSKAHRWGAFRHAIEMKESGITPEDSQFLEGMNWDLEAVARAYAWPLDLLGGRRTYENVDRAMVAAYVFSILPEAAFIASELTEQLLPMFPGEADLVFFDPSDVAVLQEAENDKWDREMGQIEKGAITINQWRASKGMEPVPWGDTWHRPNNLAPVDAPRLVAPEPPQGEREQTVLDELDRVLGPVNGYPGSGQNGYSSSR